MSRQIGIHSKNRNIARSVLRKAAKPSVDDFWLERLECALFYANSCTAESDYLSSIRGAASNLRRNNCAERYEPGAWPFLSLMFLSRDSKDVHVQRIKCQIGAYEKSHQITELEKNRLLAEINVYAESDPELCKLLIDRLEDRPVDEAELGDWESEKCPFCDSKKTRLTGQAQLRSADEPDATFHHCYACKGDFRLDG